MTNMTNCLQCSGVSESSWIFIKKNNNKTIDLLEYRNFSLNVPLHGDLIYHQEDICLRREIKFHANLSNRRTSGWHTDSFILHLNGNAGMSADGSQSHGPVECRSLQNS